MSYDNPERVTYNLGAIDFGTGSNITQLIPVPDGRAGRVERVLISAVTEDFVGSTTDAGVRVGDGSDDDKYFDTGLVLDETVDVADEAVLDLPDDGAKVDIEYGRDTVTVTCVANAGSPTGQATVSVVIAWF